MKITIIFVIKRFIIDNLSGKTKHLLINTLKKNLQWKYSLKNEDHLIFNILFSSILWVNFKPFL